MYACQECPDSAQSEAKSWTHQTKGTVHSEDNFFFPLENSTQCFLVFVRRCTPRGRWVLFLKYLLRTSLLRSFFIPSVLWESFPHTVWQFVLIWLFLSQSCFLSSIRDNAIGYLLCLTLVRQCQYQMELNWQIFKIVKAMIMECWPR